MTIVEFLTARLNEEAAAAKVALQRLEDLPDKLRRTGDEVASLYGDPQPPEGEVSPADRMWWIAKDAADWIDQHDPARVLREVEAKRAILAEHARVMLHNQWIETASGHRERGEVLVCRSCEPPRGLAGDVWPCSTLRLMASVYSDHPDYAAIE